MATEIKATATAGLVPYRLTVRQFETMIDAGVFPEGARVELLGGVLAEQMTKYAPHDFTVGCLAKLLEALTTPGWVVREEKAVVLGVNWRPEPDLAVAIGPLDRYRTVQPHAEDLVLLIEVAETTYAVDRREKWPGYAASGVPTYWIVNLPLRQVEVYTNPNGQGKAAGYRDAVNYGPDDEVSVVLAGRELGKVAVKDVLP